jgi:hypothetical protein
LKEIIEVNRICPEEISKEDAIKRFEAAEEDL